MNMNCNDLDHMLNALPWKEKERQLDDTIIYECKIEEEIKND
jgi:hypothetical protein